MRPIVPAAALLAVVGGVALFAYAVIRPALFIVILSSMALAGFFACLSPEMRLRVGRAPIILALGLPLAAWLMPNIWLLYAVMLVAVPLLARNPGQVAPLYLFALLLLPALNLTIVAGSLKLFEVGVNEFLATGAAFALAIRPGKARIPRALDLPVIALVLLLVIATTRSTSITNFFRVLVSGVLDCALPYYIVSRGVRSVDDLKLCMIHLAAAASVLSMILLYEAHSSWPMYNILYDHYGIVERLMVKLRGGVLRASGPFLESTSMAMVLSSCILATWLSRSAFRSKWHHLAVLALLFAGLTAPQSRGAWMGLLIGILVADAYRRRIGAAIRRVMLIGVMVAALVAVAPLSPYLSDTLGLSEGSASTVDYRQRLFDRGMEEFWRSPIVGYSPPDILARLDDMRQGEGIIDFVNTYIYFALVSGIIGLIVFVVSFLTYLMLLWRDRRFVRANDPDGEAIALVFAGLVMPMEMLVFTSFGGRPEIFVFVFFAFASAIVSMRKQAQRIETPWPLLWSDVQRPTLKSEAPVSH
jgi:O-antigen ligase